MKAPDEKRFSVSMRDVALQEQFDNYRYGRRVSQNQAAIELIEAGLKALEKDGVVNFMTLIDDKRPAENGEPSAQDVQLAQMISALEPGAYQAICHVVQAFQSGESQGHDESGINR